MCGASMFSRLGVNSQGEPQLFRSERSERWWEGRQRSRQAGKLWKSKPGKEGGREGGGLWGRAAQGRRVHMPGRGSGG